MIELGLNSTRFSEQALIEQAKHSDFDSALQLLRTRCGEPPLFSFVLNGAFSPAPLGNHIDFVGLFAISQPHHAVLRKRGFPGSVRIAPNWRHFVSASCRLDFTCRFGAFVSRLAPPISCGRALCPSTGHGWPCPARSHTTKQASSSSTDHGGGKRRVSRRDPSKLRYFSTLDNKQE